MPITAAVVNPTVAAIDISITYLPDTYISRKRNGARVFASQRLQSPWLPGYGFRDSVYALSCDHPLIAGVWAAK
jgi:hypothetical protein